MCSAWICDGKFPVFYSYICLAFDEMTEDLGSIAILKTTQLLGQHVVQGIGHHGHNDIKVNFNKDRRRQGIKIEKLDCFRNDIFDTPSAGVIAYK